MFGQYPLQVNGFKDLHECLEAAMIEGEIESLHSENSGKSGQEVSLASTLFPFPLGLSYSNVKHNLKFYLYSYLIIEQEYSEYVFGLNDGNLDIFGKPAQLI